jgi:uncharacterized protein
MSEDWARPVVHWEIQVRDPQAQRRFYSQMFNWDIADAPIMLIPAGKGAPDPEGFTGHLLPGDAARVVLYVQVRNLRESLERARELGGAVLREPFDVPNGPTIARISDPEGNQIALVQQ